MIEGWVAVVLMLVAWVFGCVIGGWAATRIDESEHPSYIEERWLELKRVTKSEWCHLMNDSGYRAEWQLMFKNIKERRK